MRSALLFVSAAALSISSAVADPAATNPAPAAVAAQPASSTNDPNKMVCRTKSAPIGSRLGSTRECRTQREWDDITAQDRREVEKMQAGGNLAPQGH
ncbi:MAG TPA: hypothetical protein VMF58_10285 [Rhizomicrobium sp.]|nr:hypothetical protein [Rhizomicrobium sp.]